MEKGAENVSDDELLYRRIPLVWFDVATGLIADDAFKPTPEDKTGLSLYRAKHIDPKTLVGRSKSGKPFYVAGILAKDLREHGLDVRVNDPSEPVHVELPHIRYDNKKDDNVRSHIRWLAKTCPKQLSDQILPTAL
jgi:hypothetical protein